MRIKIKNTKIFKVDRDCKYHWSKLSRFVEFMQKNTLDLSWADLRGADLSRANLRGADLSWANLRGADLSGAIISDPENVNKITIKDFMLVQGLGSCDRVTYFFDTEKKGLIVRCGCFYGTEEKFREKIKETHKDGQFAKEYLAMLDVVKIRFSRENKNAR